MPYLVAALQRDIEDGEEGGMLSDCELAIARRLLLLLKKAEQKYVYPF